MDKLKVGFLINNYNHIDQSTIEILNNLNKKKSNFL